MLTKVRGMFSVLKLLSNISLPLWSSGGWVYNTKLRKKTHWQFGWININIQRAFFNSSRWSSMPALEFCFKTYCFVPCTTLHCFEKQWNVPWDKNACPLSKFVWVGDETDMRCHYPNMAHICFVRWPIFMSQPPTCVNSLRPGHAYMRQWNMPSLVQIMACRLLSAKPLSEPMMVYRKLEPQEQNSVKIWSEFKHFH